VIARQRFALALAGTVVWPAAARAQSAVLRVASAPEEDMLSLIYADRSGIFRRHGLDVKISAGAVGSAISAAVIGGSLDIGKGSILGLVAARARGVPFVLLAPAAEYDSAAPITATIVAGDSPIRAPRDLEGKTVAVASLRGMSQVMTMAWIDQRGGDAKAVKFVELPQAAIPAAVIERRIEGGTVGNPPLADALTKNCRILGACGDAVASRWLISAYFATTDFVAKNPATARNFVRALAESSTYTNAHPVETAPLVAEFTGVPLPTIRTMTRVRSGIRLEPREIQPVLDVALKYGAITAPMDAAAIIAPAALSS
jgi:NitT/TauT family transport system substrate-binding protein